MMFRKAAVLAAALLALASFAASAQLKEDAASSSVSDGSYFARPFVKGDQTIGIDVDAQVPLFVFGGDATTTDTQTYVGASLAFSYQYFVAPGLAVGGTLTGAFNETYGSRSLVVAPLTFRIAYWFVAFKAVEMGFFLDPGVYLMTVSSEYMFGPMVKAGFALSYRISNGWSLGTQATYWFIPEIHTGEYADSTRFGNSLQTGIFAIYHL